MSVLVPFGATWRVLANQPLQSTGVDDPTGMADPAFDDSAPAVTVTDTFTRSNSSTSLGNADTGEAWSALSGTWGIASNKGYLASATGQAVAVLDTGEADGTLTVDVTTSSTADRTDDGIVFRAADDNNYMLVTIVKHPAGENSLNLWKKVAGSYTLLATAMSGAFADGTTYTVEAIYVGTSIEIKVNGTSEITYGTSTGLEANTKVGIRVNEGAGVDDGGSRFDNLFFVGTAWADEPGAFASGGASTGIVCPTTITLGSNGPVLCQTEIGINCEAYYRKHVGALGPVTVKGWIDNTIWVFINGTLEYTGDFGSGGEWSFPYTFTGPDNVIAIRSRSTGDTPSGGHIMAAQIFNVHRGWVQGADRW